MVGTSAPHPRPFTIAFPQGELADLRDRLSRARLPDRTPSGPWEAGVEPGYLRELIDYWLHKFDWRAAEATLNSFPQFVVDLNGTRMHYVHVRGARAPEAAERGSVEPLPLLLAHGWPSAFIEMLPVVAALTDPGAHGGDPNDAFDVVIPSLPGTGFADVPEEPVTQPYMADQWAALMTDVLGYERYGVSGGDVGGDVVHWMAIRRPDQVVGLHTIHPKVNYSEDPPRTEHEEANVAQLALEDEQDGGYSHIQVTRPDTIAAALLDSPSGLAAWIVDKFNAWGDTGGDIERRFSKDTLLTLITFYWLTGSIGVTRSPGRKPR